MKQLWLHSVRLYLKIGLFFYFKKITVVNADKVPKDGAVLLLANHQNALLDALLIATNSGRFSYFLTRASVFNNKLISKILKSLLMIPVYRIRDGWGNLTKNNSVFSSTAKLLSKQKAIVIFPEGSHNLKRTVRPLSKGFTRIIFETLNDFPDTKITLVPVGVNFVHAERFADSTLLNFGNAIVVDANSTKSASELKETIFKELCQLTTHINSDDYDETLKKLEHLNVDFLNPDAVNTCIASNFKTCKAVKKESNTFKKLFKVLLIINLFLPYLLWKKVFQPKINEIEFTSTFRFAIAISVVPIFLVLIMVLLSLTIGVKFAIMYLLNVLVLTLLAVKL